MKKTLNPLLICSQRNSGIIYFICKSEFFENTLERRVLCLKNKKHEN